MTRGVIYVKENMSFKEIAEILSYYRISGVIVIDEKKKPIGVISETDMIKAVIEGKTHRKAREIMSNTIFSIDPEATVKEAAKAMRKHRIRRLFVVPGGKGEGLIDKIPMGIISSGDIVMELARVKLH